MKPFIILLFTLCLANNTFAAPKNEEQEVVNVATPNSLPLSNEEAAAQNLEKALAGDANAQYATGKAYAEGKGVNTDLNEAFKCFKKSAEQGNAGAQYEVGFIYETGELVEQDYETAVSWYLKAAEKKNLDADTHLYLKAARKGDLDANIGLNLNAAMKAKDAANVKLGWFYFLGLGVEQNYELALQYLEKATAFNVIRASQASHMNFLSSFRLEESRLVGFMYLQGLGTEKNAAKAFPHILAVAELSEEPESDVKGILCAMYARGDGITKSISTATKWCEQALNEGNETVRPLLGELHSPRVKYIGYFTEWWLKYGKWFLSIICIMIVLHRVFNKVPE